MIDINSWLPVPDFPNYEIRINTNELKSLKYRHKIWVEKVIIWWLDKSNHKVYRLNKKTIYFHQIVARIKYGYWCPIKLNVCHNDGNPLNNHPDNLRYDTSWSNHKDKFKHWYKSHSEKIVMQYSLGWEFIKEWDSGKKASIYLWIHATSISACCKWKLKFAYWFIWKFKN